MRIHRTILRLPLSIAIVLLILTASPGLASAAMVRLLGAVEVTSPVILLGDVAEIRDSDPQRVAELQAITLAPAPAAGRQVRLDFETIRSRLLVHGVNLAQLEFSGQGTVVITAPAVRPVAPPELKPVPQAKPLPPRITDVQVRRAVQLLSGAIEAHVARTSLGHGAVRATVEVDPDDVPAVLAAKGGRYEFAADSLAIGGPQSATVRFEDADGEPQAVPVTVWLEAFEQVLAVKSSVPRGYVIQASDLVWQPVEEPGEAIRQIEEVVGKETSRALRKDEVLRPQDVKSIPLVRPNDIVTVYVRLPGLTIRRQFKAQTGGAMDEAVTLLTLDTREKVQARVTGYHEAELFGAETPQRDLIQDATGSIQFVPMKTP